jgi:dTDP-4-dehydrorhamnose 3,5-epimerase
MKVTETTLPGVLLIEPVVFGDARGFFMESWHQEKYEKAGVPARFKQDNLSFSQKGVLRGMHFQNPGTQGKLVSVLKGEVFDVAVDVRVGSPHFGKWVGYLLSAENKHQLYVPEGFAHGFIVTSDDALFQYKCTDLYQPQHECSLKWDDPDVGIVWPKNVTPALSKKDLEGLRLKDIPHEKLPRFS